MTNNNKFRVTNVDVSKPLIALFENLDFHNLSAYKEGIINAFLTGIRVPKIIDKSFANLTGMPG